MFLALFETAFLQEEQRRQRGLLQQNQGQVRSWLQLGNVTLDTFVYLTEAVPDAFLDPVRDEMDRLANGEVVFCSNSEIVSLRC